MVYKFTLLSDEVDDFVRVINIDAEAKFIDLHTEILKSVGYEKNLMTSFFICDENWEKGQEVTLVEMESSSEYDNLTMGSTSLEELISEENQKIIYVFDMLSERVFFIELTEIIPLKDLKLAECVMSEGNPPAQAVEDELFTATAAQKTSVDTEFYGDEDFELDELDEDGYGEMNFDDSSLFADDNRF